MSNRNTIGRNSVMIFLALFLVMGDSGLESAQDEQVCDSWRLQGFWIGMPKQDALALHPVRKTLKQGSMAWKTMLQEHTGAQRRKDVPTSGYEIYQIKNEPPDKSRFLVLKDDVVVGYRTAKPKTANDIIGAISRILGDPVWTGDVSTEVGGMGVLAQWESAECGSVMTVSRVPTARWGKALLADDLEGNEATDTLIRISSFEEEVKAGQGVLD